MPDGGRDVVVAMLLLKGVLLGIAAAAPIGPVNVEIARRTLGQGRRAGFLVGCGAVTVDVGYAALTSLSLTQLRPSGVFYGVLAVVGVGVLTWLGITTWVGAIRAWRARATPALDPAHSPGTPAADGARHYLTGLLMTLLNPMTLAFWFTIVPAQALAAASGYAGDAGQHPARSLPIICVGVFLGTIGWVMLFVGLLGLAGGRAERGRRRWVIFTDAVGGTVLLGFALTAAVAFLRWNGPDL